MRTSYAKPHQFGPPLRYALAIALVAAALLLSLALQPSFGNPFWLLFPAAVIAGTWFGGRGPGWLAVGLSTLVVLYYFIPPIRSFAIKPRDGKDASRLPGSSRPNG
jgi:K+-sensing histidine kinase KdpD